ncbi:monocarboxylate transporter 9-like [Osmia bicornis bicornis]|uniref:monocarboxylate transporter 9-like n=1 Tax=Osmia bicornis bicornis TaxID=1437191 RepID=UPI0010F851C1|nr:monocarboxylate transporter 9-like [Osmia bicornis bicornis]
MKMSAEEVTVVPPDGNWGWMIVVAYALNGICTVSLMQGFVLIFKDTFPLFGFNATESTVIINTNLAFGMILGLTNGPLLRTFGYRKMAVIGSILYSIGVFMTTFARSFTFLIISYGVFASLGTTITSSAFSYALNSYFTTKRGRAISLALTIIGLGPIIVPQITTFFVSYYGFQGTILLYGAFSLHSLVGSLLLRPLKWYAKNVTNQTDTTNEIPSNNEKENKIIDEKTILQDEESSKDSAPDISDNLQKKRRITISSIDHDAEIGSIYGFDISYIRQLSETPSEIDVYQSTEDCSRVAKERKIARLNNRFKSIETINLGSSMKIFEGKPISVKYSNLNGYEANDSVKTNATENNTLLEENNTKSTLDNGTDNNEKPKKKWSLLRIFKMITELFDLNLLRDPIYVNIMLGMSVAIFAEINFSQLTPFILSDMKLSNNQIATTMSVIASVDLVFRTLAPFVGEWLHQTPRIMYMFSLCLLILSRTSLLFADGFVSVIIVAVGIGTAKGFRSVYMSLVIPAYVPIERLPNASGIQMIVNGVILLSAGPMLGVMRDSIGSYTCSLITINSATALTVIMWSIEIVIVKRRNSKTKSEQQEHC